MQPASFLSRAAGLGFVTVVALGAVHVGEQGSDALNGDPDLLGAKVAESEVQPPPSSLIEKARTVSARELVDKIRAVTVDVEHVFSEHNTWSSNEWFNYREKAVLLGKTAADYVLLTTWCVLDPQAPGHWTERGGNDDVMWDSRVVRIKRPNTSTIEERVGNGVLAVEYVGQPEVNLGLVKVRASSAAGQLLASMPSLGLTDPEHDVTLMLDALDTVYGLHGRGKVACPTSGTPPELDPEAPTRDFPVAGGAFTMALAGTVLKGAEVDPAYPQEARVRRQVAQAFLLRFSVPDSEAVPDADLRTVPAGDRPYLLVATRGWLDGPDAMKTKEWLPVEPRAWFGRNERGLLAGEIRTWLSSKAAGSSNWYPVLSPSEARTAFAFSEGHPTDGGVYVVSNDAPDKYYPLATYFDDVWSQRLRMFWTCAASLAPKFVDLTSATRAGQQVDLHAEVATVAAAASATGGYEHTQEADQRVRVTYAQPVAGTALSPAPECHQAWLSQFRDDRVSRWMESTDIELRSADMTTVTAEIHAKFARWGFSVGATYHEYQEQKLKFSAVFWPLEPDGRVLGSVPTNAHPPPEIPTPVPVVPEPPGTSAAPTVTTPPVEGSR